MKKSLFALAALGAFAGTAQAQSSVTIYGNLDAAFVHDSGSGAASNGLVAAANSTSLWGLTGSEDLGGGNKMGFDLKSEINLATGATGSGTNVPATAVLTTGPTATTPQASGNTSNLFNRGANIFMSSASLGEVKVGRMDDIEWAMSGTFSTSNSNSFGSNQAHAQMGNVAGFGLGSVCATTTQYIANNGICTVANGTTKQGNSSSFDGTSDAFTAGIQYTTPSFAGIQVKVQSSMGSQSGTIAAGNGFYTGGQQAAGITYNGNGLYLGASTARRMDEQGILASVYSTFGAKYEVTPMITLTGTYSTSQYVNNSLNAATNNPTGNAGVAGTTAATGLSGTNFYSFGVNYKTTANSDVSLSYTNVTSDANTNNSAVMYGLTGRYNFSKRTQAYAGIGQSNNSGGYALSPIYGGSTYTAANAGTAVGGNIWATMLGLKHTF